MAWRNGIAQEPAGPAPAEGRALDEVSRASSRGARRLACSLL